MEGFQQQGDSEIAKIIYSLIKDDHALNSHLKNLHPISSSKQYILPNNIFSSAET